MDYINFPKVLFGVAFYPTEAQNKGVLGRLWNMRLATARYVT